MLRDIRKDSAYFAELLPQYIEAIAELEVSLDDGSQPLPDDQTGMANDLFELWLMYAIASYSSGESIAELKPKVANILAAKKVYLEKAATLPARQQVFRNQYETLSGTGPDGQDYISHYINIIWWLSLVQATGQSAEHSLEVLACIGHRGEDALLDHIAIVLGGKVQPVAELLLYPHLYRPLLKAFGATPSQRPALIKAFLTDWYSSCSETAWYNNHSVEFQEGNWDYYFGYWSLEAVLVANLLDIDDSSFKEHWHYPADLRST